MTRDDFEPFQSRHIGPDPAERDAMLEAVGAASLDALIDEAIPARIRLTAPLDLPAGETEHQLPPRAARHSPPGISCSRPYIGLGYYDCVTPSVILRNVLENPGWYTPYTPYQAEIAQGRLEALLNFQTMVRDLTGMEVANASLLDEATAAAEAMTMLHRVQTQADRQRRRSARSSSSPIVLPADDRRAARPRRAARHRAASSAICRRRPSTIAMFGALLQSPDEAGRRARPARVHRRGAKAARRRWWRSRPIC